VAKSMQIELQERDIAVLINLYIYRYLSTSQLKTLHFPSERTTWRRMSKLTNAGWVKRFKAPTVDEYIYHLDTDGIALVADHVQENPTGLPEGEPTRRSPKDYLFLRHFLQINDFRIALTQACAMNGVELAGYIPEHIGRKTKRGGIKKHISATVPDRGHRNATITHTPDAVFSLRKTGNTALFFLELDRGTEVISDPSKGFLKCIRFYLNYWVDGGYNRYQQEFDLQEPFSTFRTLIVTTSDKRVQNMRQACTALQTEDEEAKRYIWLTTQHNLSPQRLFASVWVTATLDDTQAYKIG